jgi:hypothetical protein
MRFVRLAQGRGGARVIGALIVAGALSGTAGCAQAVANSDSISVTANPTTVNAGSSVQITANCGQNVSSATVSSTAFGSQSLQAKSGSLSTTVVVLSSTPSGKFGVRVQCPNGSQAMTDITVVSVNPSAAASQPGPNTGGGFLADHPEETTAAAGEPADRTPLVWLGAGVGFLLAATAVAVRGKQRATVRSRRQPPGRDQGTAGRR